MTETVFPQPEHLPSPELLTELRSPEELLEMAILSLQAEAKRISVINFESPEKVQDALTNFNEMALVIFDSIDFIGRIEIVMSGEGVRVPNNAFEVANSEGKTGVSLVLEDGKAFMPLKPYQTEFGYVEGTYGEAYEKIDGTFHLDLNLIALLSNVDKESITLPDGRTDILEIFVKKRALVRLDGTAEIKVTPLEQVREVETLQKEIAKLGLAHTLFMAKLSNLQRALYNEDPSNFMDLDKLKLLRKLGSLGEVQARRGDGHSTAVSQAILNVIGKDRKVGIGYIEKMDENISTSSMKIGSVLEILMPASPDDTIAPTIVLESIDALGNDDPFSIRFDQITAFRF